MGIGYAWRPWYGHPRPATEEDTPMPTKKTDAVTLPKGKNEGVTRGRLLRLSRTGTPAEREAALAELDRLATKESA